MGNGIHLYQGGHVGRAGDVRAAAGRGGRSGDARRRLLVDGNNSAASFPHGPGVHHLIEAQAGRTPESVAVVGGEHSLTYGDLEAGANRLAITCGGWASAPTPSSGCA